MDAQEVWLLDQADQDLVGRREAGQHDGREGVRHEQGDPDCGHERRRQDRVADEPERAGGHERCPGVRVDVARHESPIASCEAIVATIPTATSASATAATTVC
jgi:hypothetical protein